jgi:hypothetical protein
LTPLEIRVGRLEQAAREKDAVIEAYQRELLQSARIQRQVSGQLAQVSGELAAVKQELSRSTDVQRRVSGKLTDLEPELLQSARVQREVSGRIEHLVGQVDKIGDSVGDILAKTTSAASPTSLHDLNVTSLVEGAPRTPTRDPLPVERTPDVISGVYTNSPAPHTADVVSRIGSTPAPVRRNLCAMRG